MVPVLTMLEVFLTITIEIENDQLLPIQNDESHTGIIDVSSLERNRIASHEKYVRDKKEKQKKKMKTGGMNKMELF